MLTNLLKDTDAQSAFSECIVADGLTNDANCTTFALTCRRRRRIAINNEIALRFQPLAAFFAHLFRIGPAGFKIKGSALAGIRVLS